MLQINFSKLKHQIWQYALLMRLHRPIGIYLLLWPTMWALWIAGNGQPEIHIVAVFVTGVILMRSAGCVINDYADRHIDPLVERTKYRPLATGQISPKQALILFVALCLLAFMLVFALNEFTRWLSLGGAFLATTYPFTKRYSHFPQVYLGAAFGWAVPMAFAALTNQVPIEAWLLFSATLLLAVAYDTMYAMVDREDDLKIGVKSTAIIFANYDKHFIGLFQVAFLAILIIVAERLQFGGFFYVGMAVAAGLCIYQQVLIRNREPNACFQAFLNNHWLGLAIFIGILLDYAYPLPR